MQYLGLTSLGSAMYDLEKKFTLTYTEIDNFIFYNTIGQAVFVNLTCVIGAFGLVFMIYAIKQSSLNTFIHYSLVGSAVTWFAFRLFSSTSSKAKKE